MHVTLPRIAALTETLPRAGCRRILEQRNLATLYNDWGAICFDQPEAGHSRCNFVTKPASRAPSPRPFVYASSPIDFDLALKHEHQFLAVLDGL